MKKAIATLFTLGAFAFLPANAEPSPRPELLQNQAAAGVVKVCDDCHSRWWSHHRWGSNEWHSRWRSHNRLASGWNDEEWHNRWRSHNRWGSEWHCRWRSHRCDGY
jgi:hypothetical protein